jgi:D-alanine-D-alanine ligase
MDKVKTKEVYKAAGLPVVESVLATREEVEAGHVLPAPYVVKPYNEGSSVGVYIVREGSNAPRLAASMPAVVMVETYAPGRELSVSSPTAGMTMTRNTSRGAAGMNCPRTCPQR